VSARPLAFAGHALDRADPVRSDPARLAELAHAEARLLLTVRGWTSFGHAFDC